MALSKEEIFRYSRHLILPEVGMEGQQKLAAAKVLLIGAGGLGSPSGLYLASAGVGTLGIVDFDVVDVTNLQRQIMHGTEWIGKPKVDSAVARLKSVNPHVKVVPYKERLTSENALAIFKEYDVIVDGTDNFQTRYLSNDAAYLTGKPLVYGSIFRFEGHATVFVPGKGCYRCMYPEPPPPGSVPSCAEGGVLGILPGIIGVIQATEAVKLIIGKGRTLQGRFLIYNAMDMKFRELKLPHDKDCPLCGDRPTVKALIDYEQFCGLTRGEEEKSNGHDVAGSQLSVTELKALLDAGRTPVLLDVREPEELQINRLPGARHIPLGNLPDRLHELDSADDIVAYCHTGARSNRAMLFLRQMGFAKVKNLAGGIDAWADEIDPEVPKY